VTSPLNLLIRLRLRCARHAVSDLRHHSVLKIVVITVMASGIWAFLYIMFRDGLSYLNREMFTGFKEVVVSVILSLFFFTLMVLLFFSNAIIAYGSLFRSQETAFLFARPVPDWQLYLYKLGETLLFSSWAFLFLALPMIVAYGVTQRAPWHYYPGAAVVFGAFALLPAVWGGIATLLVARIVSGSPRRVLATMAGVALFGASIWWLGILQAFNEGMRSSGEMWIQSVIGHLRMTENPLLPSRWAAAAVRDLAAGALGRAWRNTWLLLTNGLFFGMVGAYAARWLYATGYQRVQGRGGRHGRVRTNLPYRILERLLFGVNTQMRLLLVKDVKTFLRDPAQWSQGLLFFGLLAVYFSNLRNFSYNIGSLFWSNFISLMNICATSLTLSTFTCRFIFPLLSLEGRRFWILGLLPLSRRKLMYGKFWFALMGSFVISEGLMILSDVMLQVPPEGMLLHAGTVLMLCSGLSGLAVGLGAVYPNLREDNPAKIVSGFGGTLNLVLSMLYVAMTVALAAAPYHVSRMTDRLTHAEMMGRYIPGGLMLALGVSMAATFIPLWLGERAFARIES